MGLFHFLDIILTHFVMEAKIKIAQHKVGSFLAPDHTSREEKKNNDKIRMMEKDYFKKHLDPTSYMEALAGLYVYFDETIIENHIDPEDLEEPVTAEDVLDDDAGLQDDSPPVADMPEWAAEVMDWDASPEQVEERECFKFRV